MARRVLKDNKIPGTCMGTRAAEALSRSQGLLQDSWKRAKLGCVSSQMLVWTRGACIGRICQKEKEEIEALSTQLENSLQQLRPLAPLSPQPLDCECGISSPSTHLKPDCAHPD